MQRSAAAAKVAQLLDAGRLDEAEAVLRPLHEADPLDPDLLADLGLIAFRRRDMAQARSLLERATAVCPQHAAAHSNLSAVFAERSEFPAAEVHARAALALDPTDAEAQVTLAECLVARERFDEAERGYHTAARTERWSVAEQVRFGRTFFDAARTAGGRTTLPAVRSIAHRGHEDATHVIYLACSPDYMERYAGSLLESLSANGGADGLLHLHLVGTSPHLEDRLERLPSRYARLRMNITAESPDTRSFTDEGRIAFYTSARFLRVPELLEAYGKPVITLDVDAIVEGPTQQLVDAAVSGDLALMLRMPQRIVWTNVLAGAAVFNPTLRALAYARLVKGFIQASMTAGRLAWNLDQIALYCSLVMMRRFDDAPQVAAVNEAAERVIYQLSPLRGAKQTDRKYTEYFAEI